MTLDDMLASLFPEGHDVRNDNGVLLGSGPLRGGGRAVVIGNARHGAMLSLNPGVFNQGKSLLGTWGGDSVPDRDYGRFGRLLGSGRFPVRDLLSKPYSLEQADQALQDLAAGKVGRPLIDMSLRRSG